MVTIERRTLHAILTDALMAPSADNNHRVRFQILDNDILVHSTAGGLPSAGGYHHALALLSLGAMAETLSIAASRFGMAAMMELLPDARRPNLLIHVRLLPGQTAEDPLWRLIPQRHTNRSVWFWGPAMNPQEREQLHASITPLPGCQLSWLDGTRRQAAIRLMRLAETARFRHQPLHQELFSAIRFDIGRNATCAEGLPPGALGIEPVLRPFFGMLRYWPVMHLFNLAGMHHVLGWRACTLPCRIAPDLGLVTVKNIDNPSLFAAGRAFQRLWLSITAQGRALQPMPASAIFALPRAHEEAIPHPLQARLQQGWRDLLGESTPVMLFRTGFARSGDIRTTRPSLDRVLADAG